MGIIHFHDADYFAQHMHNCCLVNLDDMLQNGTVISETMIEKPHSFSTACNIATQCIAQIASSQYGGQSISLAHLAPFVQISRDKYRKAVREEFKAAGIEASEETMDSGTETHTQNVNTETTAQTRAFNSGLIDTAKSKTATPTANTDILSFDNRKNLKSIGYNGYKETETYNDISDVSTYDNLNHAITHNVTDTVNYDNLKRETTFNDVTDTNNQTSTAEETVSNSTKTTSKIHGNIGVTTTAQMLEGERELSEFDFIDIVYRTVIGELSCGFVVQEEGYYDNQNL